ncbi:MAG: hypothetical protein B6242_08835 [Anaerolineaceae bacterium 4572_78]|nr:MAG: hypothetical protein B6242_08835 [Anaerolineaceae bacterium 4572_78]
MNRQKIAKAIYKLDAWLESMRNEQGYTGPISHWWASCLLYSGPMIDWRYEGIISGYLNLHRITQNTRWLSRAITAGDDICQAQLPSGKFFNSSFQVGPIEGGTPHEAAVDVALLELATYLKEMNDDRWEKYYRTAGLNLKEYYLSELWQGEAFLDQHWNNTLVPNKNATAIEALLLYQTLSGDSMETYVFKAVEVIFRGQVLDNSLRHGGVVHLGTGKHQLAIGIYTARIVGAMVRLYEQYPNPEYRRSFQAMGEFLLRLINEHGTYFGYYPHGKLIRCPNWISPSGDVLRALLVLQPHMNIPQNKIEQLVKVLFTNQHASGGIATAYKLDKKGAKYLLKSELPDFRDVLPVVGWCDKTFRALTLLATAEAMNSALSEIGHNSYHEMDCTWNKQLCLYVEDTKEIHLTAVDGKKTLYQWRKGEWYPKIYRL